MNLILWPLLDKGVAVYLDNTIIYSKSIEDHVRLLKLILAWFSEHKLFLKRSKYTFVVPTIDFIGHIISSKGVLPDSSKIESIQLLPILTSVHNVLVFLGMAGYYSCFVPKYANKTAALTDLLKKSNKWQWTVAALELFKLLKLMLSIAPILLYHWFDLPFVYSTDALNVGV